MPHVRLHPYGFTVLIVGVALLLMQLLDSLASMSKTPFLLFFGSVVVSAWRGGVRAGLLATALAAFCSNYFFSEPRYSLALDAANQIRTVVFLLESVLTSVLCGSLRKTNQQLDRSLLKLQSSEESLRLANFRITELLESVTAGFYCLDREWRFIYINQQAEQVLGQPRARLLGNPIWQLFPQGQDSIFAQNFQRSVAEKIPLVFEAQGVVNADQWYEVHINPLRDGLAVYFQDVTERKQAEVDLRQSEERYRYLAESIPQLVWTANQEGVLLDVNQRWLHFTGLTLAQAQTEGWQAVVHPDDVSFLGQQWVIARQDRTYYQAEGRMRRSDGVYRWHLHQAVPLKNKQEQVIKWFGTATDIEEQKQLEQQRNHLLKQEQSAREAAEAANRIKDEFLAVLSHELRSPLNPILGWARLLQTRQFDSDATRRALEAIERNAILQTQLIDDLLDVSRILRGKMMLNVSPVNLVKTIEAALEIVQLAAEAKGIQIKTKLVEGGYILGDANRLQQIVWNLLSNAIKFTPSGGQVTVQLDCIKNEQSHDQIEAPLEENPFPDLVEHFYAKITVRDTGKGISAEFLPYIFEYFRQEDSKTTRQFGGLGIGLAIVKHLTELHGGSIQATSSGEGLGATFTVKFPLMETEELSEPPPLPLKSFDLKPLRILIVDDEVDMRELICTILQQEGVEVQNVASAAEAVQTLQSFKPDILISDIGMPETDGYQLLQQIRRLPSEAGGLTPAIALTAYAGELNQQQALAAGFQSHLAKPIAPEALIQAIVDLLPG